MTTIYENLDVFGKGDRQILEAQLTAGFTSGNSLQLGMSSCYCKLSAMYVLPGRVFRGTRHHMIASDVQPVDVRQSKRPLESGWRKCGSQTSSERDESC